MREAVRVFRRAAGLSLASLMLATSAPTLASGVETPPTAATCNRACLAGQLEAYLAALAQRAPGQLTWAAGARFTENSVTLRPGQGLWATAGDVGAFHYAFFDPLRQSMVFIGTISENGNEAIVGIRLRVVDGALAEAEHLVVRNEAAARRFGAPRPSSRFSGRAASGQPPVDQAALAAAPDAYFDAIEAVSARGVSFADDCLRIENGQQTTGVADLARGPFLELDSPSWRAVLAEGCRASIDSGANAHITAATDRRLLVVDELAGVAVAGVVFEHTGTIAEIERDGRRIVFPRQLRQPFDTSIFELFALDDERRIDHVEAIGIQLPLATGSGW
ncbi:hypothetical protein [Tsuneonella sp. HG222]